MKHKLFTFILLGVALIFAGCDNQAPTSSDLSEADELQSLEFAPTISKRGKGSDEITVMDWNIYVGTDVDAVLGASTRDEIPVLAAQAFQLLLSTNFPERAQAVAKQVARFRPHLIGLQEVSLLRIQSPGDAIVGGVPATDVLFDYLAILMDALSARGLDYKVAGKIQNTDAEVPMIVGFDPLAFDDVRLTDFDVVLARADVKISNVTETNYQRKLSIPALGLDILRGYVAVDAKVGKKKYRFVNTHLEPRSSGEAIQLGQAQELVDALQDEKLPIILVGDLNTRPPDAVTYQFMQSQDFVDIWPLNRKRDKRNPKGFTSPHDADLRNPTANLFQRIDLILVRSNHDDDREDGDGDESDIKVKATVIGDEQRDQTPSGLWPSDHAGVVAKLKIPFKKHFEKNISHTVSD